MPEPEAKFDPQPPILALDLGQKIVGVALSDELKITIKRLAPLKRTNWKHLLHNVKALIDRFDARTLVIGLPLNLDGTSGPAAQSILKIAENFARSLQVPVYLQDERLTSEEARLSLLQNGYTREEVDVRIDSEAAAIILSDFLNSGEQKLLVMRVK